MNKQQAETDEPSGNRLKRELGTVNAVMLGLGSIVGTGIFVSLGLTASAAGNLFLLSIVIAALLAICNGLSSAQLAALHPVSGGTYEYGYHWLTPPAGFAAGWLFLCAKSASAGTAALGAAAYIQTLVPGTAVLPLNVLALIVLALLLVIVLVGMKRTAIVNTVIVSITLVSLFAFAIALFATGPVEGVSEPAAAGMSEPESRTAETKTGFAALSGMLAGAALMFVAYTGYGRIATLGEEVAHPRRTIPVAIIITLAVTMLLYLAVAAAIAITYGTIPLARAGQAGTATLQRFARGTGVGWLVSIGAVTAMLGVLLNLLLGLSRVVLAMSRRSDLPGWFRQIDSRGVPVRATVLVAVVIAVPALIGNIAHSWSFSAFTVLIYYSLTNVCALRVSAEQRIYSRWISVCGLAGCLGLALFIDPRIMLWGLGLIAAGFVFRAVQARLPVVSGNE